MFRLGPPVQRAPATTFSATTVPTGGLPLLLQPLKCVEFFSRFLEGDDVIVGFLVSR